MRRLAGLLQQNHRGCRNGLGFFRQQPGELAVIGSRGGGQAAHAHGRTQGDYRAGSEHQLAAGGSVAADSSQCRADIIGGMNVVDARCHQSVPKVATVRVRLLSSRNSSCALH